MARETKAQLAERMLAEQKAQERAQKAAERKAAKAAATTVKEIAPQTIIVDFSADVKKALTDLTETLVKMVTLVQTASNKVVDTPPVKAKATVVAEAKTDVPKVEQQELFKSSTASATSLTAIREMINLKVGENKTNGVVKLLNAHGAASASTLAEENYDAFYSDLKNL